MKTKILSIAAAVFAITMATPAAFARPDFPVKRQTSGPAIKSTVQTQMPDHCAGMTCCTTKWVSNAALGGRGAIKKVRACENSCNLSAKEKQMDCRRGSRA